MPSRTAAIAFILIILSITVTAVEQQQQLEKPKAKMSSTRMCGGISDNKEPDETVLEILETIRPELETKLGQSLTKYKPVSFKSQLVNGVNYFIKVDIGNDKFIHVRAYRSFAGDTSLRALQADKQKHDEIEYFDIE